MRLKHVSAPASLTVRDLDPQLYLWGEMLLRGCSAYYNVQPSLSKTVAFQGTMTIQDRDGVLLGKAQFHSKDELTARASELVTSCFALTKPVVGSYVEHYKGGRYQVKALARNSEDRSEWRVIYHSLKFDVLWDRPLSVWNEMARWPAGGQRLLPRFMTLELSKQENAA